MSFSYIHIYTRKKKNYISKHWFMRSKMLAWPPATVYSPSVTHKSCSTSKVTDWLPLLLDHGGVSTKVSDCFTWFFGFMFDQNDNCLLSLWCVFFCNLAKVCLHLIKSSFLHHSKASVPSLIALFSLDQERLFYKDSQNYCTFMYFGSIISLFIFSKTNCVYIKMSK